MIENPYGAVLVLFGLTVFGYAYDRIVSCAKPKGFLEPYTALWVAAGAGVTIGGIAVLDLFVNANAGLLAAACFFCSGVPMIVGDAVRFIRKYQHELNSLRGL